MTKDPEMSGESDGKMPASRSSADIVSVEAHGPNGASSAEAPDRAQLAVSHELNPSDAPDQLDEAAAKALTVTIKAALAEYDAVWPAVAAAYLGRVWLALNYDSWNSYCEAEFGALGVVLRKNDRIEVITSLVNAGLPTRAIASVTQLAQTRDNHLVRSVESSDSTDRRVVGADGRSYPRRQIGVTKSVRSRSAQASALAPKLLDSGTSASPSELPALVQAHLPPSLLLTSVTAIRGEIKSLRLRLSQLVSDPRFDTNRAWIGSDLRDPANDLLATISTLLGLVDNKEPPS